MDQCSRVNSRQQPCRDRLCISLHSANLSGEEDIRVPLHLQSLFEQRWSIEIGVAMDLSIAQKSCVLKSRNETQHARLLPEFQVILETDEVVGIGTQVLTAKLYDRIRHRSRH